METRINWNEEQMGRLVELYREGRSFSLIAADIGVSRSAAIGKAHRMKLPRRIEITQSLPPRPKLVSQQESNARRARIQRAAAANMVAQRYEVMIDPARDYRCSMIELRNTSCRFPLWDASTPPPQRLYCGRPGASVAAGIPYCQHHTALCETSPQG